jgi:hypothetical protein
MRKISFLILVYLFTTAGFFKSALEDCADILIKEAPQFNKKGIFNNIEMSNAEKLIAKKKWKKRLKEYKLKKKNNERDIGFFMDGYDPLGPPIYKKVLIKKISKQENQKAGSCNEILLNNNYKWDLKHVEKFFKKFMKYKEESKKEDINFNPDYKPSPEMQNWLAYYYNIYIYLVKEKQFYKRLYPAVNTRNEIKGMRPF